MLQALFEQWFGVMLEEIVWLDGIYPQARALVEGQLMAEVAGGHFQACSAQLPGAVQGMLQQLRTDALGLAAWGDGDIHQLQCASAACLHYIDADGYAIALGEVAVTVRQVSLHKWQMRIGFEQQGQRQLRRAARADKNGRLHRRVQRT